VPALSEIDRPPGSLTAELAPLRAGVHAELPARTANTVLIGTWNIRAFAGLTAAWQTGAHDSPKRNLADVCAIAEIVSRFDVVAIQEVRSDLTALRTLMRRLGSNWEFLVTDVTAGQRGNGERLTYVFDRRKLRPSGLVGELVIDEATFGDAATPLRHQFARTPYLVSFASPDASIAFTLMTLHIDYGKKPADRTPEIVTFAKRLKHDAADPDEFSRNLIALGDFNIDRWDDPNGQAFVSVGLTPPDELLDQPRSIFDDATTQHYFDQIAWFTGGDREELTLRYTKRAGRVEWTKYVLTDLSNTAKSWRISDHYPLWAQFARPG
jgi:endonuclease/exonuclease/phosphatase family metal-dependent hydrolase